MSDDDSTIVILTVENNEDPAISYEPLALDDINKLIDEEKPEEESTDKIDETNVDESLKDREDAVGSSLASLDTDTINQSAIGESSESTPEEIIESQGREIGRLKDALESYSAEVKRLNSEATRLKEENSCLSENNRRLNGNYSGTPDLTINIRKREAFATLI